MVKDGLSIDVHRIKAIWDGPELWEYDEFDEFIHNGLINRSI